jgi:hypothetical protein
MEKLLRKKNKINIDGIEYFNKVKFSTNEHSDLYSQKFFDILQRLNANNIDIAILT